MVEQVVEEKEQEEFFIGVSTPDEVYSTKVLAKHKSGMNE